ncbi:hypothetical protein [Bradyrhizobium sp. RT3a]|uniref:hypothetical protein n=1 Tax=unclassified Bradyrhizobium TaxID=2631580 RepID=UPI0033975C7E
MSMLRVGGFRTSSQARIVYLGGQRGLVLKLMPSARTYEEVSRYASVASHIPTPRLICSARLGGKGAILYERARSLGNGFELLADAFFQKNERIVRSIISEVLDTYASLIDRTLLWQDRTEANLVYFDDRIRSDRLTDWYLNASPFHNFVVSSESNGFRVNLLEILEYLIEWAEHPLPTFSILSQGDPTEVNIGVPLCFFDFWAAGRNPVLGDMANLVWSIHAQGGYFAPIYNPVAVEFRSFVDRSIERNRPQISFEIDERKRTIEVRGRIIPDDCRRVALSLFVDSALWASTRKLFLARGLNAEAEILPYLLCRVLFVFDPRRMHIKDRIGLLASAAELYCKGGGWYLNQFAKKL